MFSVACLLKWRHFEINMRSQSISIGPFPHGKGLGKGLGNGVGEGAGEGVREGVGEGGEGAGEGVGEGFWHVTFLGWGRGGVGVGVWGRGCGETGGGDKTGGV